MNKEDLPGEIMDIIKGMFMDKVNCFNDYVSFSQACGSFRSFAKERLYEKPWIMLSNKPGEKSRAFYSPLEGKFYHLKLPKIVRRSFCCGSYEGWLIMAHKSKGNFMYNPITRKRLKLPTHQVEYIYPKYERRSYTHHLKRCPYFLFKVVLSAVPAGCASSSSHPPLPPSSVAAIDDNHKILVTFSDNKWHSFSPLTLEEEYGLLSPTGLYINDDEDPAFFGFFYSDEDEDEAEAEEGEQQPEEQQEEEGEEEQQEEEEEEEHEEHNEEQEEEVEVGEGGAEEDGEEEVEVHASDGDEKITDIIFYQGEFYAVNKNGELVIFRVTNQQDEFSFRKLSILPIKLKMKELEDLNCNYLVESCYGELMLVVRIRTGYLVEGCIDPFRRTYGRYKTIKFLVFKLDGSTNSGSSEPCRWVKVESLGNQVLFLGKNYSKSVSSTNIQIPLEKTMGSRNCIYFTDDIPSHYQDYDLLFASPYKDSGVYHLEDGRIHELLPSELPEHYVYGFRGQPLWFTPTIW